MNTPDNPLQRRARELGITLVEREHIPSSRRAHECTEYARAHGKLEPFHAGVLRVYWSGGKDIHDWDVLRAVAREVGLDDAVMQAEVDAGTWKRAVDERLRGARELGVNAVPTFIINERFALQGAQPGTVFEQVFTEL
jgi:predicted DsbA family dithiol-disulfide isomerase